MVNSCKNCEVKNERNIVTIDTNLIISENNDITLEEYSEIISEDDINNKNGKYCFICSKKKKNEEFIKLECCNSEEFCKSCISIWVSSDINKNCPKCRSKEKFHNTCKKNNILVKNTIQYYLDLYNLQHPSEYFSSPQEMEEKNNKYINNICRDSLCYMAKLYSCMCSNCIKKLRIINTIKNSAEGSCLDLDEIITIMNIINEV